MCYEEPVIKRDNREDSIAVQADPQGAQPNDVTEALWQALEPLHASLPPGYHIEIAGSMEQSGKADASIKKLQPLMIAGMLMRNTLILTQQVADNFAAGLPASDAVVEARARPVVLSALASRAGLRATHSGQLLGPAGLCADRRRGGRYGHHPIVRPGALCPSVPRAAMIASVRRQGRAPVGWAGLGRQTYQHATQFATANAADR